MAKIYLYRGWVGLTEMFNTKEEIETYCKQILLEQYQKRHREKHFFNPPIPIILEKTKIDKRNENIIKHILYYNYLEDWSGNLKKYKVQITYNEINIRG
jgi:hypothetical protein